MGAAFKIGEQLFWGSNRAVEAYVEAMARIGEEGFGAADAVTTFFREELEGFYSGKVVYLDEILTGKPACDQFLFLLDAATEAVYGEFTDLGREWINTTMKSLRERLAGRPVSPPSAQ